MKPDAFASPQEEIKGRSSGSQGLCGKPSAIPHSAPEAGDEDYRCLVENLQEGVWAIDSNDRTTYVNPRMAEVLGYTAAEMLGRSALDFAPQELRAEYRRILDVHRQRTNVQFESFLVHKDGRLVQARLSTTSLRDEAGNHLGAMAAVVDITQLKLAEQELRQLGAYNRRLIEASLDPLVTIGPDGRITDVNRATEAATGLSRASLIGTDFAEYFTEPEQARSGYRLAFDKGEVRDYPLEIRRHDGQVTPVLYNASVYRDDAGNVLGVFAAARDITEKRRAEQTLEAERRQHRDVLDMLPAYVVLLTQDYHVRFANRFFRERFGEDRGKRCFEYLFGREGPCDNCETFKALKTKAPHRWEWTGPDGRDYDIFDFPFTDVDGALLIMEMGLDITERKQAEVVLRESRDILEACVQERTTELAQSNAQLRTEIEDRKRAEEQIKQSLSEKEILLRELYHRV